MKTPIFLWKHDTQLIDMEKLHDQHGGNSTQHRVVDGKRIITQAENAANALSVLPFCDVDSLWDTVIQSVKFSIERGETSEQMKSRIHTDVMSLTTEHKRQFS